MTTIVVYDTIWLKELVGSTVENAINYLSKLDKNCVLDYNPDVLNMDYEKYLAYTMPTDAVIDKQIAVLQEKLLNFKGNKNGNK